MRSPSRSLRTSLIGDDSASKLDLLQTGTLVDTLRIQDDCDKLDPWTFSKPPTKAALDLYNVWSREKLAAGARRLCGLLRESQVPPRTIKIVDYRVAKNNFDCSPVLSFAREMVVGAGRYTSDFNPVQMLCEELINHGGLAVCPVSMRNQRPSELPTWDGMEPGTSIGDPVAREISLQIFAHAPAHSGFSTITDINMCVEPLDASYWLSNIFYSGKSLTSLSLTMLSPWIPDRPEAPILPRLTSLKLFGARVTSAMLHTMLASSHKSLEHIGLSGSRYTDEGRWADLLSSIASTCTALRSFQLAILRDCRPGIDALDWIGVSVEILPEECRAGLHLPQKGPADKKRVNEVRYSGPHASKVLGIIGPLGV